VSRSALPLLPGVVIYTSEDSGSFTTAFLGFLLKKVSIFFAKLSIELLALLEPQ
jgi:hypothetical protein